MTDHLDAWRTPGGSLVVWCEHCGHAHWHSSAYGPRRPHCDRPGSPYETRGYVLVRPSATTPPPWWVNVLGEDRR